MKSLMRLSQTDLGFRPDHVLTFRLALPDESYPPERSLPFVEQLLARLKAHPEWRRRRSATARRWGDGATAPGPRSRSARRAAWQRRWSA